MMLRQMAEQAAREVALQLDSSKYVRQEIASAIERVARAFASDALHEAWKSSAFDEPTRNRNRREWIAEAIAAAESGEP